MVNEIRRGDIRGLNKGRSSVKVPEFDKHLKKAGGYISRNFVEIKIKMKTIVRKPVMIKIMGTVTFKIYLGIHYLYWPSGNCFLMIASNLKLPFKKTSFDMKKNHKFTNGPGDLGSVPPPGFELVSPCPFPTTITITPRVPPIYIYIYIYIYILSFTYRIFCSIKTIRCSLTLLMLQAWIEIRRTLRQPDILLLNYRHFQRNQRGF